MTMPPVEQPFDADGTQYLETLAAMAEAADKFAEANNKALLSMRAVAEQAGAMARAAADVAAAEAAAAEETGAAAAAAAEDAAAAAASARAQHDQAEGAAAAAAAEKIAAAASEGRAKALLSESAAAAMALRMEAALNARLRAGFATEQAAAKAADQLKDALEAVAFAERIADEETGRLTQAWFGEALAAKAAAEAEQLAAEKAAAAGAAARVLAAGQRQAATIAAGLAAAQNQVRDVLDAVALAEEIAAQEAEKLAEAQAAGSLAAYQDAQMAKALAEADAVAAAGEGMAAQAAKDQAAAMALATAGMGMATKAALGLAAASTAGAVKLAGMLNLGKLFKGGLWTFAAWHYIIDGALEFGIILAGASLALTAFGIAGAHAADAILTHFQALTIVSSATGQAIAPLTNNMVALQKAMAPDVIQLYGDALGVVNAKQGAFATLARQSGAILDQWGARAALALEHSGTAAQFAGRAASYLNGVLQLLANIFGVLGNLMRAAMDTHIAEILLGIVSGAVRLLGVLTSIPTPLLAVVLGLHGLWLWGKLGASVLGTIVGWLSRTAVSAIALGVKFGFLGDEAVAMAQKVGAGEAELAVLSEATAAATGETGLLVGAMNLLKAAAPLAILAGAVALGVYAYHLATAQSATERWANSLQAAVDKASVLNGLNVTFGALAKTTIQAGQATRQWDALLARGEAAAKANAGANIQIAGSGVAVVARYIQMREAQQRFTAEATMAISRTGYLAGRFGGLSQALGLASLAGVKWSTILHGSAADWKAAVQQIQALVTGYRMMGQSGSAIANDTNAATFAIEMQDSKVQQLNQDWATFIGTVTGGESSFTGFEQQMVGLGQAIAGNSATLTDSNGKISLSSKLLGGAATAASGAKASFNGLNTASLGMRSTFQQTITSASTLLQSITTMGAAMANGAAGEKLISSASRDVVAQLMTMAKAGGYTRAEVYALAQEAGYHGVDSLKKMSQWAGSTQGAATRLNRALAQLTIQSSGLTKDVNALGAALGINLNAQMAKAVAAASGVQGAMSAFTSDIMNNSASMSKTAGDRKAFIADLIKTGESPKTAIQQLETLTTQVMRGREAMLGAHTPAITMVRDLSELGVRSGFTRTQIANMISTVTGMPKQKVLNILMQLNGHNAAPGDYQKYGSSAAHGVAAGINGGAPAATGAAQRLAGGVVTRVRGMTPQMAAAGTSVVQGFIHGIESMFGAVASAAAGLVSSLGGTVMHALGIGSPSRVFHQYGLWTVQGLINGLLAGGPKLAAAVRNMINSLVREFQAHEISAGERSTMVQWVERDNARLQQLGAQRKAIVAQIAAVTATEKAVQSSFSSIIGLGHAPAPLTAKQQAAIPTAQQMVANLQTELADLRRFAADLKKLAALGLDRGIIQRIVAMGPITGTAYAEALIKASTPPTGAPKPGGGPRGGPPTVGGPPVATGILAQLNSAYAQIEAYTKTQANSVAGSMYDAGKQGAAGLIAGLKSQEKAIDAVMKHIATVLVHAIKRDMRIKSPSEVMIEHGLAISEGLARGVALGEPMVVTALRSMALMIARTRMTVPPAVLPHVLNPGGPGSFVTPGGGRVPVPIGPGGINPGGTVVVHENHYHLDARVMSDHQLMAFIRDGVQYHLHNNPESGLTPRPGRR